MSRINKRQRRRFSFKSFCLFIAFECKWHSKLISIWCDDSFPLQWRHTPLKSRFLSLCIQLQSCSQYSVNLINDSKILLASFPKKRWFVVFFSLKWEIALTVGEGKSVKIRKLRHSNQMIWYLSRIECDVCCYKIFRLKTSDNQKWKRARVWERLEIDIN